MVAAVSTTETCDGLELIGSRHLAQVKRSARDDCRTPEVGGDHAAVHAASLGALALVPEIWLPDPRIRSEREQAQFRLHLWVQVVLGLGVAAWLLGLGVAVVDLRRMHGESRTR
jgi:hypothetical protein